MYTDEYLKEQDKDFIMEELKHHIEYINILFKFLKEKL